jgi:hypothetical protein
LITWASYFSLPEFANEVQQAIQPVLNAYIKVRDIGTIIGIETPSYIDKILEI